jgi:amino acid adenylation domain-containing protein
VSPQSSPPLLPLTAAQHGIWNAQQLDPTSPYYVVGEVLELRGNPGSRPGAESRVDTAILADAVRLTVDEAETLRLRFTNGVDGADGPRQYVDPTPATRPEIIDLSGAPDPRLTAEAIIDAEKAACGERWRTMTDGPLFRYLILDLGTGRGGEPGEVWCIQLYHHIIVDGYSAALLTRRTAAHYTALAGGKPARRNRFATVAEIVEADRAYREGPDHAADRDFWLARMSPLPDTTGREDLVHGAGTASITTSVRLDASEVDELQARAERRGLVWSDMVVAAYAAWLRKLGVTGRGRTGSGDDGCEALIAMPMMARTSGVLRRTPAMLVNMLPLRFPVDADATVTDLAGVARDALDAARRHQRFPGSELARELGAPAVLHGVGLNLKTFDIGLDFHGIPGVLRNVAGGPPEDLVLVVTPASDGGVDLAFETDPQSVDAATARRRLEDIRALLTAEGPLHSIRLRTPQDQAAAAERRSGAPLPDDYPDLDALVDSLAYGTGRLVGGTAPHLDADPDGDLAGPALAARIGEFAELVSGRSRTGDVIALDLPKSPDLAAALLGVWRSHRVAVVLDREHPQARRDQILADSGAVAVLDENGIRPIPSPGPGTASAADGLAYLLYTSGTTGTPKGVRVPRSAVEALFAGHHAALYPDAWSRARGGTVLHVAHTASFSFDAAIDQLSWVFTGATVHLYPTDTVGDPASMRAALIEDGIDVLDATPSLAGALIDSGALDESSVSTVILGGEAVPRSLWDRLAQAAGPTFAAWNVYGPTETTVDALSARVTAGPVTIGVPVPGMTAEILDVDGEIVPDNETGELYLSGPQVALGYHDRPDQTAAAFDSADGIRRYRTGDLVTWVPSPHGAERGAHHFLGRVDEQLEIRGHRVEPAEVEAALLALPGVTGAAVATFGEPGALRLIAHVTTDSGPGTGAGTGEQAGAALRTELAARVPGHLVPTRVLVHDRLPLTVGGKVDRAALAALAADAADSPRPADLSGTGPGTPGRRPVTDAEQALAEVVADVLGVPDGTAVDLGRDFITLGGDSIGALTAAGRLRRCGWAVQAKDLLTGVDLCDVAAGATRVAVTGQGNVPRTGTSPDAGPGTPLRYATGAVPTGAVTGPRPSYLGRLHVPGDAAADVHAVAHAVTTLMSTHGALRAVLDDADRAAPRFIVPRVPLVPAESVIAPASVTDDELTESLDPAAGVVWRIAVSTGPDGRDTGATVRVAVDAGVADAASSARILDDLADALRGRSRTRDHTVAGTGDSWRSGAPAPRTVASTPVRTNHAPLPDAPDALARLTELYSVTAEDAAVAIALLATGGPVDLLTRGRHGPSGPASSTPSATPVGALSSVRHVPALPGATQASARTALLHAKEHRARAGVSTGTATETGATPPAALTVACGDTRMVPHGHAAVCPLLTVGDTGFALTTTRGAGTSADEADALLHRLTDAATALAVLSRTSDGGASPSDLHVDGIDQTTVDTWEQHHGPLADVLPLSPLQEGMLYHCVRGGDGYVLAAGVDLRGDVDPDLLHAAFRRVLTRHDLLRARFDTTTCDNPVQLIPRTVALPWRTVDLRGLPRHAAVTAADDLLRQASSRSVDPGTGPLVTATLVLLPDEAGAAPTARLVLGSHHLLTDGWSTPVMLRDLLAIYHDEPLPPVTPYSDYLRWLAARDPHDADDAWRSRLDGLDRGTVVASLAPATATDPAVGESVSGSVSESVREIAPHAATTLLQRARRDGVTPNTVLQAAWTLTLAALTGRDDVVFGTTVSGRPTELEGIENTVGLFINTLPSRVRLRRTESLTDLLTGIRRAQAEMTAHASTPLVHIEQLAGVGSLFDTLVVYDNFPPLDTAGGDDPARLTVAEVHSAGTTDIPLSVVVPPGDTPRILLAHQPNLVDPAFVEHAARILTLVLTHVADQPASTVGEVLDAVAATAPPWRPTQDAPTATGGAGPDPAPAAAPSHAATEVTAGTTTGTVAEHIAAVMGDLLGRADVDVHDNFFDIGGHSLLAMRLLGKLRRVGAHGLEAVTIQDIVETGSPAALAARLTPAVPGVSSGQDVLPLSTGTGAPLVCVHPAGGLALPFRGLATRLGGADGGGVPVTGLQLPDPLPQVDDVSGLAAHYVDTLLRVHPQGPYRLLGYSFGGVVAQAMTADLTRRGHAVTYLGIMDAYPAGDGPRSAAGPDGAPDAGPSVGLTADELRALTATDADAGLLSRNLRFCDRLLRTATPVDMSGFPGTAQLFIATRADARLTDHPAWDPAPAWRATLPREPDVLSLPTTHAGLAGDDGWTRIAPVIHSVLTSTEEPQP